jgi:predicted Rossmann fold flavoprotein
MFTENGIGGPAVFELSRLITDFLPAEANPIKVSIDLLPQYEIGQLNKEIVLLCSKQPGKQIVNVLSVLLAKSLLLKLFEQITIPADILACKLRKEQRSRLVKIIKQLAVSIVATRPISEATVTRGGVAVDEINPRTMESKLCGGLFFAGEVINADGPSGGFNLQIAFSTGRLAGKAAAETLSANRRSSIHQGP